MLKKVFSANCASIRAHPQLSILPFTVFFSNDINETDSLQYQKECPHAKTEMFPFEQFPDSVKRLDHYRFKAIHHSMAFKNHKILLSFDSSILFNKNANFSDLIESSIKGNPTDVSLLTPANHNMFSTTHPKMYDCFPNIKPESMLKVPQFQSGLILWIGSEMGWKAMKRFVECSLQPTCIAPPGATIKCNIQRIYKNQRAFSGCHRFDQAAINLILYENSNHKPELYQRRSPWFKVSRKP
uniref:Uncharacterized protein n=1 Tax=Panagrolaimus davidi TaxID=227884 RepID=A0A914PAB0_9BILA